MFEKNNLPLVIGHRGAARFAPENTLESIRLAFDTYRADMVEFDVRLAGDATSVIIHDATLERTTNGRGYVVKQPLAQLKKLDAGNGFRIPTFAELLAAFPGKKLSVEIKERPASFTHHVISEIKKAGAEKNCIVGSKFETVSKTMRENYPDIYRFLSRQEVMKLYLAFRSRVSVPKDPFAVASMPVQSCGFDFGAPDFISFLHEREIKAFYWTVNDPALMKRLAAAKADGMISDDPGLLSEIIRPRGTGPTGV